MTWDELLGKVSEKAHIWIYGAGKVGKAVCHVLKCEGIEPEGFLETDPQAETESETGKPLWSIEKYQEARMKESVVLLSTLSAQNEQLDNLFRLGIEHVIKLPKNLIQDARIRNSIDRVNQQQQIYEVVSDYPQAEPSLVVIRNRMLKHAVLRSAIKQELWELLKNPSLLENSWALLGQLPKLPYVGKDDLTEETVHDVGLEIYLMTSHLDKFNADEDCPIGRIPLQVGAAQTDIRKGCLTDDEGISISEKNGNYSECTGLYWMWKNTKGQKYIGLEHYRRRLGLGNAGINTIREESVDVVVALPVCASATVKKFFEAYICSCDWMLLKKYVIEYDSRYEDIWESYENSYIFLANNICVMKREVFDRYCGFAFHVAGKIEREYEERNLIRQDRYMGYLFENLLSLFLIRHHEELNIYYADLEFFPGK